jgi:hypothetical protein
LRDLDVQLVDLHGKFLELLVLLVDHVLQVLDGSEEFFDSGLESVDFLFLLRAFNLEHAQLVDELLLLGDLVAEVFDGALLSGQVLLKFGNLALQGLDLSALTDQAFKLCGSEDDADGEVLVLALELLDLSVTLRKNNLELLEFL